MRKIITIIGFVLACALLNAQTQISVGMSGAQVRNAINGNFTTVYQNVDTALDSRQSVNIKDYGAVGNGTTNDATAFVNAIEDAVSRQLVLYIPKGTFYLSGATYNIVISGRLDIVGAPGAIIKGNQSTIIIKTTAGDAENLKADVSKGDAYITTTTLHETLSEGNIIEFTSSDWWGTQESFYKGEMQRVRAISNDTVYLDQSLYDGYESTTTTIKNQNAQKVSISNIKFQDVGLTITRGTDVRVYDCYFTGFTGDAMLYSTLSYGVNFSNNIVGRDQYNGHRYGIDIASCQNVMIYNNEVSYQDQAIICGGWFPVRNITYDHNYVYNGTGAGQIDVHANAEYVTVSRNFVSGTKQAMYIKGNYVKIIDNECVLLASSQIGITKSEERISDTTNNNFHPNYYTVITGNRVYDGIEGLTDTYAYRISWETTRDTIDLLEFSNNYCKVSGKGLVYTHTQVNLYNYIKHFNIANNYIETTGATGIGIHNVNNSTFYENTNIHDNYFKTPYYAIYWKMTGGQDSAAYMNIHNNTFISAGQEVIIINNTSLINFHNNRMGVGRISLDVIDYAIIKNNIFENTIWSPITLGASVLNSIVDRNIYFGGQNNNTLQPNTIIVNY